MSITASARATRGWRPSAGPGLVGLGLCEEHHASERGYAAKELPQFEQNREAGASTAAPHCAHAPFRYFPQEEQNTGSGSGRGPHVSHDRRIDRYRSTAASAWSTCSSTGPALGATDGAPSEAGR